MRRDDPTTTPVVADVVKRYALVTAVDGVSFAVERGEVVALLGPYGAGKSTVARMPCGILGSDEVRLRFDPRGGPRARPRRRAVDGEPAERAAPTPERFVAWALGSPCRGS